jgi:hypothetical protein
MLVASIAFGGDGLFPEISTIGEFSSVAAGITCLVFSSLRMDS